MNILLTGPIQVGKSTLIQTVLSRHPAWQIGGFLTETSWESVDGVCGGVYLRHIHAPTVYSPENRIGIRAQHGKTAFAQVFEQVGVLALQAQSADLIVMDELGVMENDAPQFQAAVLRWLHSDVPVFAVVKPKQTPFLDAVRGCPNTRLFSVTAENRAHLLSGVDAAVASAVQEGIEHRCLG